MPSSSTHTHRLSSFAGAVVWTRNQVCKPERPRRPAHMGDMHQLCVDLHKLLCDPPNPELGRNEPSKVLEMQVNIGTSERLGGSQNI